MRFYFLIFSLFISFSPLRAQDLQEIQNIEVEPASERERVVASVPMKVGDLWTSELNDLVQKYLESTQRYESSFVVWDMESSTVKIEVQPLYFFEDIVWSADSPPDQSEIESVCILAKENVKLSQSRISQMNQCLLRQLQQRAYLDAQVLIVPDKQILKIELILGDRYRVRELRFQGNSAISAHDLSQKVSNSPGKFFNPFGLDADTEAIRKFYLRRGYYSSEVFQPTVQVLPSEQKVDLIWRVNEGDRVEIEFSGYYRARRFLTDMVDRGESLPEWYLDGVEDEIREALRDEGFLEVKITREERQITENFKRIFVTIHKGPQYRLLEPQFVGVNNLDAVMKLYQKIGALRAGKRFNEEDFREKFEEAFFAELLKNGYVDAKLRTIEFSINRSQAVVEPLIYMTEGPQYHVEKARFVGLPEGFEDLDSYDGLFDSLRTDKIFNPLEVDEFQAKLAQELRENGFLDVEVRREIDRKKDDQLQISIHIVPGPRYRVAEILIRGLDRTQPKVVEREILIEKGEYYSRMEINDTVSQILRLGIARSVDIRVFEKIPEEGIVYLIVDILEASRFRFEFGPGYGTVDGLRGVFRATYANIGGTGRRLSLNTKASRKLEKAQRPENVLDGDSEPRPFIERRAIVEYFEPSVFDFPLDGRITLTHRKESVDNFDLLSNAFAGSVDYRLNRHWTYTPEYRIEYSNPFNVPIATETVLVDDTSPKRLHSFAQNLYTIYLDDNFSPTRGFRNYARFELFDQRLGGNLNFWLMTFKQEAFIPLFRWLTERKVNFGVALNSGFSQAYGSTEDVPVEKRFRVGGEGSVRGYSSGGIQPLGRDGEPLRNGGISSFFFRTELALPVAGSMDLLGFFDGGNIYSSNLSFNPFDLRYGVGGGLRFNTPVGPLKLGYAFVLQRQEGEDIGQIYFGVGPL